jgi:hypothetical protein
LVTIIGVGNSTQVSVYLRGNTAGITLIDAEGGLSAAAVRVTGYGAAIAVPIPPVDPLPDPNAVKGDPWQFGGVGYDTPGSLTLALDSFDLETGTDDPVLPDEGRIWLGTFTLTATGLSPMDGQLFTAQDPNLQLGDIRTFGGDDGMMPIDIDSFPLASATLTVHVLGSPVVPVPEPAGMLAAIGMILFLRSRVNGPET